MISGPVRRTGPDGYTSLYYMVGKMGQNRTGNNETFFVKTERRAVARRSGIVGPIFLDLQRSFSSLFFRLSP